MVEELVKCHGLLYAKLWKPQGCEFKSRSSHEKFIFTSYVFFHIWCYQIISYNFMCTALVWSDKLKAEASGQYITHRTEANVQPRSTIGGQSKTTNHLLKQRLQHVTDCADTLSVIAGPLMVLTVISALRRHKERSIWPACPLVSYRQRVSHGVTHMVI